jgi:TatD DNase family protein
MSGHDSPPIAQGRLIPPSLYDAHNHLQDPWLAPHRETVFTDWAHIGLRRAVVNGTCEDDWTEVAALAAAHSVVLPSYGLHPWDAGNRSPHWRERLTARFTADPSAAVGEIGIDRWILDRAKPGDPRLAGLRRTPLEEQIEVFLWQLDFATVRGRPVTIHCLQAWGVLRKLLAGHAVPARGFLLHAYSGPPEMISEFADRGAYFSFNGAFLDPRRQRSREAFRQVPRDRLLVETDAPAMPLPPEWRAYELAPAPDGSVINHPANLEAAYAALASLLCLDVVGLATTVGNNFLRFFGASPQA